MAVPWPSKPSLGAYHVSLCRALEKAGVATEIFSPGVRIPAWSGRWSRKCRQHLARPESYVVDGIPIHAPRVRFAFTRSMRRRGAQLFPGMVARWASAAVRESLLETVRRFEPDALLAHGVQPWGRLVPEIATKVGIPYAFVDHSAEDVLRLRPLSRLGRFYRDATSDARAVFAVGRPMVEHLRETMRLLPATFLPNGFDRPDVSCFEAPRPRDLEGTKLLLSAGHYYERKGFEFLVNAFAEVVRVHPEARLRIVTNAPDSLRRRIARLALGERVELAPLAEKRELMQWMARADLFVLPSWGEAFGLVGVEALSVGTPVVLGDDSGLTRELERLAGNESWGWAVPPRCVRSLSRTLIDALDDGTRLREIGMKGRRLVESSISWDRSARVVLDRLADPLPRRREATDVELQTA
jgi:glycosyltransferase involved in cell wall biosynthesis